MLAPLQNRRRHTSACFRFAASPALFFSLLLAGASICVAQQTWEKDQLAIVIANGVILQDSGEEESVFPGLPLTVQAVDSGGEGGAQRIRVTLQRPGWIAADLVMTPEKALEHFAAKLQEEPDSETWMQAVGMTYAAQGKHTEAIEAFNAILAKFPENNAALNERSGSYMALGDHAKAIDDFDTLIERAPQGAFYNNRGLCHLALGNLEAARVDFGKAIEVAPNYYVAWLKLIDVQSKMGDYPAALETAALMTQVFPQASRAWVLHSELAHMAGDYESVLVDLDKLIALEPENIQHPANKGILLRELGRFDEAMAVFDALIAAKPNEKVAWINRGVLNVNLENWEAGIRDLSQALELSPDDKGFLSFHLGRAKIGKGDYEGAVADLTVAVDDRPLAIGFLRRGEALANLERNEEAIADFDKALELDPESHYARYRRATIRQLAGEIDSALADYDALVQAGVQSPSVFANRARIHESRQNWQQAIADFEAALGSNVQDVDVIVDFIWLLATVPDEGTRDPKRAVDIATQVCEATQWQDAACVDALAVATAATGDFAKAIEYAEQAISLDPEEQRPELRKHLESFQAGKMLILKDRDKE